MHQPVLGADRWQALHVELDCEALAQGYRVEGAVLLCAVKLAEEVLEAGGGDDLEDAEGLVAGVPEVCHWSRGLKARSPASA